MLLDAGVSEEGGCSGCCGDGWLGYWSAAGGAAGEGVCSWGCHRGAAEALHSARECERRCRGGDSDCERSGDRCSMRRTGNTDDSSPGPWLLLCIGSSDSLLWALGRPSPLAEAAAAECLRRIQDPGACGELARKGLGRSS